MSWRLLGAAFDLRMPSTLRIASCMVAGVALVVALCFSAYAGYLALCAHLSAPWAAAIVAGSALVMAFILIMVTAHVKRRSARSVTPIEPRRDIPPEMFAELVRAVQSAPKEAAALSLVAGLVAGLFPELLNGASRLLKKSIWP